MPEAEHWITVKDGTSLFVRQLSPEVSVDRHLFMVHGACEHGGRYVSMARDAVARGWNVFLMDLRGHGRSGGVRTHVATFHNYVQDLATVHAHFATEPSRTAFIGQSTGGLIVARFAEDHPDRVGSSVLLAPLFRLKLAVNPFTLFAGKLLAYWLPQTRFQSRVRSEQLTHDVRVREERKRDPLIEESITAGWFVESERSMTRVFSRAGNVRCPLLVLQGSEDVVVDPRAAERWTELVNSVDRTFVLLPGQRHALLEDVEAPKTLARIFDWLEARHPPHHAERDLAAENKQA